MLGALGRQVLALIMREGHPVERSMPSPDSQAIMAQLVSGSAQQGLKPALLLKDGSQLSVLKASIDEENFPNILVCRLADGQTLYIHYAEIAGFIEDGQDFEV